MLDLGKDRICILVPGKNFRVVIMMAQESFNGGNEIRYAFEHPASNPTLRQFSKPPLDHIQPRRARGREMEVHAGVALEPALHSRTFMRAVIVNDEVQIEFRRRGLINGLQKPDKLLAPVARQTLPDNRAIQHVEGGKEGRRPMPLIIMHHRAAPSPLQGQARLRTIQCLDLTFFINGQHQGPLGRLQVQPDNIPNFFDKPLVR